MNQRVVYSHFMKLFALTCIAACSNGTAFQGDEKDPKTKNDKNASAAAPGSNGSLLPASAAAEAARRQLSNSQSKPSSEFLQEGKSLDLYVIMDKSESLYPNPGGVFRINGIKQKIDPDPGSDPNCKRLDALLDMVDAIRNRLTKGERVRMNVVTFGNDSKNLITFDKLLSLQRAEIQAKLETGLCSANEEIQLTMYAKGIDASLQNYAVNTVQAKLDVETVLFFSDGAAKDEENILRKSILDLNLKFKTRIFGILLGSTTDDCSLKKTIFSQTPMSTRECMEEVVGQVPGRVIQVDDAAGLSNAMVSLLKK